MTLAELEKFAAAIRAAGGNDDTIIKAVAHNGSVKAITNTLVYTTTGHPVFKLSK